MITNDTLRYFSVFSQRQSSGNVRVKCNFCDKVFNFPCRDGALKDHLTYFPCLEVAFDSTEQHQYDKTF